MVFAKRSRRIKAFEDISKKIIEKCKGFPLAAKALGSLMHNKRTRREWRDVLNKRFQPLFLSYYDLAPTVNCCLLYCANFPKDYEFERNNLINLWMTQDYLNSKGNKDKGEVGQAFFDNLVARSFFQDLKKDSVSGKIISYKMHDITHDFVQSLTKNECLIIGVEGVDNEIEVLGEKVCYLTLVLEHGEPLPPSNAYYNCKNLYSNFILQLKCLRTLNLSESGLSEIPKEIAALQLGDLGVFNLGGSLTIILEGNVKDESELEKAQLWHMKQLFHVGINSEHVQYKQTGSNVEILNDTTCPNWMMSLHNLRIISLLGWSECKFCLLWGNCFSGNRQRSNVTDIIILLVFPQVERTQNWLHVCVGRVGSRHGRVEQRGF
ncbi:disease resistance protein RGA3 [Pyrus ussuriensis x Pyrus communis]|uniref:Disease resistance protein RGA3 n=1 Tax=Pyrus ussuriensis x Pyrus communis TaxID=2448454 RepID=A0A5N5HX90_9ROSA|nr:disease resistance protein RGA3 [Pyrus ussuriensis x Pyrus communis]